MRKPASTLRPPSTSRIREWVKERAFSTPRDLRLETDGSSSDPTVVSFSLPETDWRDPLTPAEIDVVEDVLAGLGNAQIAGKRTSSPRTVANQLASIYKKLRVRSRLELSIYVLAGRHTFERG